MAVSELLTTYAKLGSPERMRLLLLAVDDWASEIPQQKMRQRLLAVIAEMSQADIVSVVRPPAGTSPDEVHKAIEGMIVLGPEEQARRLAAPLVALWASRAHENNNDLAVLESIVGVLSPSSLASLQQMASHMNRPFGTVRRTGRVI
jgi:hypothetical protein